MEISKVLCSLHLGIVCVCRVSKIWRFWEKEIPANYARFHKQGKNRRRTLRSRCPCPWYLLLCASHCWGRLNIQTSHLILVKVLLPILFTLISCFILFVIMKVHWFQKIIVFLFALNLIVSAHYHKTASIHVLMCFFLHPF